MHFDLKIYVLNHKKDVKSCAFYQLRILMLIDTESHREVNRDLILLGRFKVRITAIMLNGISFSSFKVGYKMFFIHTLEY